ncbi:AAA family ATPase [Bilophila wadsworthia]|uniref:AAA family ATPase n=1 Tax=Bilophila wadsworthia TaxID=35833 RepID=UPI002591319C|nr:AAA family ATPase [Bilophila wadsworthia]
MCRITPYDPTVKALFEETELSQREAAARLGVSPALVNQLLNRGTLPKTGWAGLKKGLASLLEERGAQAALVDYALGKLEKLAGDEDTPAGDTAESEEPMILKKQTLTMKARQAFNMVRNPFTPPREAEDVYLSPETRHVRDTMFDVATNGGFLAVVGESGSGKSTLREELVDLINAENGKTIIVEPYVLTMAEKESNGKPMLARHITEAVMSAVAPGESIPSSPEKQSQKLHRLLRSAYAAGTHYCVIIEEAHDLNRHTLKSLKRFLELKEGRHPLLSIILIGQTELGEKLNPADPWMREVVQRCDVLHIAPIEDVAGFLRFRFSRAGLDFGKIFTEDGVDAIKESLTVAQDRSGKGVYMGYPLMIANMTIAALNLAASAGEKQVTADVVKMVRP